MTTLDKKLEEILQKFQDDNDGLWDKFMEGTDPDPQKYDDSIDDALKEAVNHLTTLFSNLVEEIIGEDELDHSIINRWWKERWEDGKLYEHIIIENQLRAEQRQRKLKILGGGSE